MRVFNFICSYNKLMNLVDSFYVYKLEGLLLSDVMRLDCWTRGGVPALPSHIVIDLIASPSNELIALCPCAICN